jgi:hypothetical protein
MKPFQQHVWLVGSLSLPNRVSADACPSGLNNTLDTKRRFSTNRPPFVKWGIWRFSPKLFWIWKHIHVHKVHVYEGYAHEVHAYEVHP